jgi:hypothetical protein
MKEILCNGTFRSYSSAPSCRASGSTICGTQRRLWLSLQGYPPRLYPNNWGTRALHSLRTLIPTCFHICRRRRPPRWRRSCLKLRPGSALPTGRNKPQGTKRGVSRNEVPDRIMLFYMTGRSLSRVAKRAGSRPISTAHPHINPASASAPDGRSAGSARVS